MFSLPGACEVCGKMLRNNRALAGHLRHNTDPPHEGLKKRWHHWRAHRFTRQCRKCGERWEASGGQRHRKRCPRCDRLRQDLGKRAYEALPSCKPAAPRPSQVRWDPSGLLYQQVVSGLHAGEFVNQLKERLGITYKVVRAVGEHALGVEGYRDFMRSRKSAVGRKNVRRSHEKYQALTSRQKAALLKKRFGGTCQLERTFASQLREAGHTALKMNDWQSIPIGGRRVPREADIKLDLGDGRKLIILCDGEAFHGPQVIFGDPQERIALDRQTALGFFALGYSVVRYSESEIHEGSALMHLSATLSRLQSCQKVYRNWHPVEEVVV